MKILYLYSEIMGYTIATIRSLVASGVEVHVVHWDHKKLTPYELPELTNVHFYKRSELSVEGLQSLAERLSPRLTVISGWMDSDYLKVAKRLRLKNGIVVTCFDDQWHGTLRQRIGSLLGNLGFLSKYYSHAWVAGVHQFEYARKLGFKKNRILYDLLSADLTLFNKACCNNFQHNENNYPHRFLFVGRFEPIKGLNTLLTAWDLLVGKRRDWELHLVGNGKLKPVLESTPGVVVKDFMQPEELIQEAVNAGCFILPSFGEPWGVVVHEFSAAGLPLIVSDKVGAASTFLIPEYNGYIFKANNAKDLASRMMKIISSSDQSLHSMADKSYKLSKRISPETSAANLLSLIGE